MTTTHRSAAAMDKLLCKMYLKIYKFSGTDLADIWHLTTSYGVHQLIFRTTPLAWMYPSWLYLLDQYGTWSWLPALTSAITWANCWSVVPRNVWWPHTGSVKVKVWSMGSIEASCGHAGRAVSSSGTSDWPTNLDQTWCVCVWWRVIELAWNYLICHL